MVPLEALLLAALLSGRADAQDPSPSPSPSPSPTAPPKRLRLDIDRLVKEKLEADARKGLPRFEDRVEVVGKSPQAMIDRFFGGIEYDCTPGGAPPGGGAPTHVEMREARWHPSPSADFEAALLKLIAEAFKGKMRGEDKYFLYRVNAKGDVSYVLREGRLPEALLYSTPGTTYELIRAYPDTKSGVKALHRLERGFATPEGKDAPPPADWQTSTCRPR
ncbi:MAG TPA: hypothetical protein VIC87_04825 [Vicinamibacteria bacterium]